MDSNKTKDDFSDSSASLEPSTHESSGNASESGGDQVDRLTSTTSTPSHHPFISSGYDTSSSATSNSTNTINTSTSTASNTIKGNPINTSISALSDTPAPPAADIASKSFSLARISAIHDELCVQVDDHAIGSLCSKCCTILMPWIDTLPQFVHENETVLKGPPNSIVRGVLLQDSEAIGVLCLVAYLDVGNVAYDRVNGLVEIMRMYREAVEAGIRVADTYRFIFRISSPAHDIPAVADIINSALENPLLTTKEYIANTKVKISLVTPLRQSYAKSTRLLSPVADDPHQGDIELSASLKLNGPWVLVPGTIIPKAVLGKAEPHKLFMVRQSVKDSAIKDVRTFPSWDSIDWNKPEDIAALNKWRGLVKENLADQPACVPGPPCSWTLAEKVVLKQAIEAAIANGLRRNKIDWNEIAETLSDHFKYKTQAAGEPMAQTTSLGKNNKVARLRFPAKKLAKDRVGSSYRTSTAVHRQAREYGDILLLLRQSKVHKYGLRELDDEGDEGDEDSEDGEDDEGKAPVKAANSTKNKKRARSESPYSKKRNKSTPEPTLTMAEKWSAEKSHLNSWYKGKQQKAVTR